MRFVKKEKRKEEFEHYASTSIRNQENYLWKQSFYKAYKKREFETAERIYLSKEKFQPGIPDVHAAYRLLKQLDYAQAIVILGTIIFIILCLIGITSCVA